MTMNLVCCLLAVGLFGCLADAQYNAEKKFPQIPQFHPPPPQNPQPPQRPQMPQPPQRPQMPQPPQRPPMPPMPQPPQPPQRPQNPMPPQKPQNPMPPQRPQNPMPPQRPQNPQAPQWDQKPQQNPPKTQTPSNPQTPSIPQVTENFHTCEVPENYKIQCGTPGISASECMDINCCFDGRTCYYGKYVTLQCTKDGQFIVVVSRDATLPNIDLETISFLGSDQSCSPVGITSAFAIYQFPVTACGTEITAEPGVIIYRNMITSSYNVYHGPAGSITRDTSFSLDVQCRYTGVSIEALVIEIGDVPPPLPVAVVGPLSVILRIANGQCLGKGCVEADAAYTSFYTEADYPVRKVLRDPVYVDVHLVDRSDPNIVLTLGRCWATADSFPHSVPQWDLLVNGCPYQDDRYQTTLIPVDASSGLEFPSHHRHFMFKMFTFVSLGGDSSNPTKKVAPVNAEGMVPLNQHIYVHCETTVCQPSNANNCEPRCFRKRRDIAGSLKKTYRHETTVASSGLIIISGEEAA